MPAVLATIFDIHRFSLHDGPGIRTTIFLKGCPLNCWWCHNPESQSPLPEKLLRGNRCLRCGACVQVCPQAGIQLLVDGIHSDRQRCTRCGACVQACLADAAEIVGREMSVDQVVEVIQREGIFSDQSGGGVTFSGGEPLSQPAFLCAILAACHAQGIHTAVDTSGYAPWAVFEDILPFTDLFLYDLKLMDDARHQRFTGVSNRLILDNLQRLAQVGAGLWLRFPLIPGINDDPQNLADVLALLLTLPGSPHLSLLPYHSAAENKYNGLQQNYALKALKVHTADELQKIEGYFREAGIAVSLGG